MCLSFRSIALHATFLQDLQQKPIHPEMPKWPIPATRGSDTVISIVWKSSGTCFNISAPAPLGKLPSPGAASCVRKRKAMKYVQVDKQKNKHTQKGQSNANTNGSVR